MHKKRLFISVLVSVLLLAFLLRIYYLPYAKFENETVRDIRVAQHMLETGALRLVGVTGEIGDDSQQQSFGPFYYYLIAGFLFFSRNPLAAISLMIFLSFLAVVLCYVMVRRFFNQELALLTSLLFACSPWFFAFVSLNLMTPAVLVPLSILLFFSVFSLVVHKKDIFILPAAVVSVLMLHLHLSSISVIIAAFLLVLFFRPRAFWSRYFGLAVILSFVLLFPFFVYNLRNDSFFQVFSFLANRYESSRFENLRDSVGIPFMLATTYFGPYLLGSEQIFQTSAVRYFFYAFDIFLILGVFFGILLVLKETFFASLKHEERRRNYVLLTWFFFPILIALLSGGNISPHYLLVLYPTQFLFLALTIIWLSKRSFQGMFALALCVAFVYLIFTVSFYLFIKQNGGTDGIYGVPFQAKKEVLQYFQDHGIDEVLFYRYVKPEYQLLAETFYPSLTLQAVSDVTERRQGYLLVDFYSRGNFAEQRMSESEQSFLKQKKRIHVKKMQIIQF